MNNKIRIAIVDAHTSFRDILTTLLQSQGYTIQAAIPGEPVAPAFYKEPPDIAIMNYKTTSPSTLEAIRFVHQQYPSVRIVVSSLFSSHLPMDEFKQLGVAGIYIKSEMNGDQLRRLLEEIVSCIPQ